MGYLLYLTSQNSYRYVQTKHPGLRKSDCSLAIVSGSKSRWDIYIETPGFLTLLIAHCFSSDCVISSRQYSHFVVNIGSGTRDVELI